MAPIYDPSNAVGQSKSDKDKTKSILLADQWTNGYLFYGWPLFLLLSNKVLCQNVPKLKRTHLRTYSPELKRTQYKVWKYPVGF